MFLTNQIAGFIKVISLEKIKGTKLIFWFAVNIRVSCKLLLLLLVVVVKIASFQYLCNILRKRGRINMIFIMKISIKVFHRLVVLFLFLIARHAQSTQNCKCVISLEYLKKDGRDEVDFFHADKHQTFLQVVTIYLYEYNQV